MKAKTTKKVPVVLNMCDAGFMFFSPAFEGKEILAAFLRKSKEWFYAIYDGAHYVGYMHFGSIKIEAHHEILKDIFPANYNDWSDYHKKLGEKVDYYECTADSYKILGELDDKNVITKIN